MNIEDRITSTLSGTLNTLDGTPGDLEAVHRTGERLRTRRRVLVGGVAAAVVALVVAGTLVVRGDEPSEVEPAPAGGSWEPLPGLPLAPRSSPVTAWTGSEVLVVGGYLTVCPANADCINPEELARDGAAYDPRTDEWREIADAPVELAGYFRSAMVGDTLVLFDGRDSWFGYDVSDDEWRELPGPGQPAADMGSLTSSEDGFVYTLSRSGRILALNVDERRWAVIPDAVHEEAETVVVTPGGFVVSAGPGEEKVVTQIMGYDFETVETGQFNPFRHWTGERLVELDLQVLENDDGTTTPYGGRLDPATGEWSPLPNQPKESGDGWSPNAADGPLLAGWGYVYNDSDGSWTRLERPDGATADHGYGAVWGDGDLFVLGGVAHHGEPTAEAWIWRRE